MKDLCVIDDDLKKNAILLLHKINPCDENFKITENKLKDILAAALKLDLCFDGIDECGIAAGTYYAAAYKIYRKHNRKTLNELIV